MTPGWSESEFERLGEERAAELNARIASIHETLACPKCKAPVGRRCRRVGTFVSDSPPLKNPHRERFEHLVPLR